METLQIKLKETVNDNSFPFLGALEVKFKNPAATSVGYVVAQMNYGGGGSGVEIKSKNGNTKVYAASSLSDTSVSGKTELTKITATGTYLFVTTGLGAEDTISFLNVRGEDFIYRFSSNGGTVTTAHMIMPPAELPFTIADQRAIWEDMCFRNLDSLFDHQVVELDDFINDEIYVIYFNASDRLFVKGTFTSAHKAIAETYGSTAKMQFAPIDSFSLDLALIPNNLSYLRLAATSVFEQNLVSITASVSYDQLWLATTAKTGMQLYLTATVLASSVIDKLLMAIAANPNIKSSMFVDTIVLKGSRTSASDAALATITGAGISVSIIA